MSRRAVFLDRDGTLIRDLHFIGKPELVELLPGVAAALGRLNEAGCSVVVVTNQSGIARGYFTQADYERVQERTERLVAADGARIDASYFCPHHPDYTGPCECRKPATLLFRRAAEDLDIDLASSWYLGDKLRDVTPAAELGGRGILIPSDRTPREDADLARRQFEVASTLDEAVDRVIESAP